MSKGEKRKQPETNESQSQPQSSLEVAAPRVKRAKATKPEPEYFEDHRNLEDLWKTAFLVGTEWHKFDEIYKLKWDFSNLENAFEDGGALHDKQVYLFGCTEPQLITFKEETKVRCIPIIVAVVFPFPPSDKIGIKSVQRETEEIIPMKKMKMDWYPYFPLEKRDSQLERRKPKVFTLGCSQRKSSLKHLKKARVKDYEYCMPYFHNPLKEDALQQSTTVDIIFPEESETVQLSCDFDWKMDKLEQFIDDLIEEGALADEQKDAFKKLVREKVLEGMKANREARQARKKAIEELSEETKLAFQNVKLYKFYPIQTPDTPNFLKDPFINRYYRRADEVL